MKIYDMKDYEKVFKLYNSGFGSMKISKITGIPKSTIVSWLFLGRIPKNFSEKWKGSILKNLDAARLKLEQMRNEKMKKLSKKINKDFLYVLGAVTGDGYIYFRPNGGGHVRISVRDKDFAQNFYTSLRKWSELNCRMYLYKGFWRVYSSSIVVARVLKNFDLNKLKFLNHEIICSFLRGLYDAEGNIHQRKIRLYNSDLKLIKIAKELLERVGISSITIYKRKREIHSIGERNVKVQPVYTLCFGRQMNIKLFYDKIGFSIKRKQGKLKSILSSYQRAWIYWSDDEIKILKKNIKATNFDVYGSKAKLCRILSHKLNRTESSIWKKIYRVQF